MQFKLAMADQMLEPHLQSILSRRTMFTIPWLQREITQLARMATERERNDVVELILALCRFAVTGFAQQSLLDRLRVTARGTHGSRIPRTADRARKGLCRDLRVQGDAAVTGLDAGLIGGGGCGGP